MATKQTNTKDNQTNQITQTQTKPKQNRQSKQQTDSTALDFTGLSFETIKDLGKYILADNYKNMKYTREQIRNYLKQPDKFEKQLREVSRYLYVSSPHYYRLINYFADMLTLDSILIPLSIDEKKIKKDGFINAYNKNVKYVENYNIKDTLGTVKGLIMLEDVYFGVERWNGNAFMLQQLNSDYCKITGVENGMFTFDYDMSYFDSKKTDANSQQIDMLANFPDEFKQMFNEYKKKKGLKWQPVPTSIAVCFKFNREQVVCFPPFVQLYEQIMDMEDQKEFQKQSTKASNFKLLVQKIPMKKDPKSDKDMVLTLPTVKQFHNGIKKELPIGIGIVSSPMDLTDISFERKRSGVYDNSLETENEIFSTAGVSSALSDGGSNNTMTLNRSIEMDEGFMFPILRQFETHFKNRLDKIGTNQYRFKLWFPNITIYNWKDMLDKALKTAEFGFPKSLVCACLGMSTNDVVNLSILENDVLSIVDKLVPLQSSHTSSNNEGGNPGKDDNKLTPAGEKTKVQDGNAK